MDGLEDIESDAENPYVENIFNVDQENVLQYGLTTAQIVHGLNEDSDQKEVLTTVENNGQDIEVIVQREAKAMRKTG